MKKIPEQYRKYLAVSLIAVAAVWVFCISLVVSVNLQRRAVAKNNTSISETASVLQTETTPSTTVPSITESAAQTSEISSPKSGETLTIDGNYATTSAEYSKPSWVVESESQSASVSAAQSESESQKAAMEATRVNVPSGKENIVKTYVDSVNKLKAEQNFNLTFTNELKLQIDSITGGNAVRQVVQKYIDSASDTTPKTFNFQNGNDSSTGSSPNKEIAPASSQCTLTADGVKNASVKNNGGGMFTVTIELKDDSQTLTEKPAIYSSCMDVMDLNALGLTSAMSVDTMNISYTGGKIVATIDSSGRIRTMTHSLTIKQGAGTGKLTLINVALEMHGTNVQNYRITY